MYECTLDFPIKSNNQNESQLETNISNDSDRPIGLISYYAIYKKKKNITVFSIMFEPLFIGYFAEICGLLNLVTILFECVET